MVLVGLSIHGWTFFTNIQNFAQFSVFSFPKSTTKASVDMFPFTVVPYAKNSVYFPYDACTPSA
jgi:hypothetical protein